MTGDMPMPPDRYQELVRARQQQPRPDPLLAVERRDPPTATSPLAAEILTEAASRELQSGELLLLSEEATVADLEQAAVALETSGEQPAVPDDPLLAALVQARLLAARVDEIFGWQPPLAEHMKLLEAALQSGLEVPQTMLVGHVETWPERIEHLMRLRDLAATRQGRILLTIRLATDAELPAGDPRVAKVAEAARPADPELDRRHTHAMARLALGPGRVTTI